LRRHRRRSPDPRIAMSPSASGGPKDKADTGEQF
jgi:hypothetical protein